MHVPHFTSSAIRAYTKSLVESDGFYDWRWADGSARFGQVALCIHPSRVLCFLPADLRYKHHRQGPNRNNCVRVWSSQILEKHAAVPIVGSENRPATGRVAPALDSQFRHEVFCKHLRSAHMAALSPKSAAFPAHPAVTAATPPPQR